MERRSEGDYWGTIHKRDTWERMYADRFSQPKRPPPLWPVPRPGKFHHLHPPPAYIPVLQVDTKSDCVGYGKLDRERNGN